MTKRLIFLLALIMTLATTALAQNAAKDSVFVIRNGHIAGAYEVGKDVDYISFKRPSAAKGNYILNGNTRTELKSALVQRKNNTSYVYLSPEEGINTVDGMLNVDHMTLSVSDDLNGQDIELKDYGQDYEGDSFFYAYYTTSDMGPDDDPIGATSYDWYDLYQGGTILVDKTDSQLTVELYWTGKNGTANLEVCYNGTYTDIKESPYYFTVDGRRSDLKAAFAEKVNDGVALYLTSAGITDAKDLENVYYYARVFLPESELDGQTIDITGDKEYELTFVDNANSTVITLANGLAGKATGSISVKRNSDGTYEASIDIEGMGKDADRSLAAYYVGEPMAYDLSTPNAFHLGEQADVSLRSAVAQHADGLYTFYLSAKENITTVEGMADADIVITVPDEFMNDMVKGFSGTETNAKISITYNGDTYNQASCGSKGLAMGGNIKAKLEGDQVTLEFNVYSIAKYKASLGGYYSGKVTIL